jgi:hypothetical protein
MIKYCDCEEIDLEMLKDLDVFSPSDYRKIVFEQPPSLSVCLGVWMCASIAPESLDAFYSYSIFDCFSVGARRIRIFYLKQYAPFRRSDKTQNGYFLENCSNNFGYISVSCGDHIYLDKTA